MIHFTFPEFAGKVKFKNAIVNLFFHRAFDSFYFKFGRISRAKQQFGKCDVNPGRFAYVFRANVWLQVTAVVFGIIIPAFERWTRSVVLSNR